MRRASFGLVFLVLVVACGSSGGGSSPPDSTPPNTDVVDDHPLQSFAGDPQFAPDYNRLVPQPWVHAVSAPQTAQAVVAADTLTFPASGNDDVAAWEVGRIVVSAPDKTAGTHNPFGFARRVLSVETSGGNLVVHTESASFDEMFTGDFQIAIHPEATTPVDLTNVDLGWAAANLYQDLDVVSAPGDTLDDDVQSPDDQATPDLGGQSLVFLPGQGGLRPQSWKSFWNMVKKGAEAIGKAFGGAAKAIADGAKDVWTKVTPSSFSGSVNLSKSMSVDYTSNLFDLEHTKDFRTKSKTPFELFVSGTGSVTSSLEFDPGFQVGARVPVPGHKAHTDVWMNIDSRLKTSLELDVALEAGIKSIASKPISKDAQDAQDLGDQGQEVLSATREKLLGDPDMRPVGGWKRTIFISRPAYTTFEAGPVPVVLTATLQLDLECGFEAKAHVDASVGIHQDGRFKYSVQYDGATNQVTHDGPTWTNDKNFTVKVTGGG